MFKKLKQDELNPNKPSSVGPDAEQSPADMGQQGDNENADGEDNKLQQIVDNLTPEECTELMTLLQDKQKNDAMGQDINFDELT